MHKHPRSNDSPLSRHDQKIVEEHVALHSPVIYEVIRQDGEIELRRPLASLWWSGIAAGVAISSSLLAEGLLRYHLPDAPWRPVVANFGYCVGFIIVILGRLQLFTENTLTAVLPLLANWSGSTVAQTIRLWVLVFVANMVGTFITALLTTFGGVSAEAHLLSMLEVAREFAAHPPAKALLYGIPAGFFIAVIVWMLPNSRGSEFWVILFLTYLIALGGFTHVVAGSSEVFLLLLAGELSVPKAIGGLLLPVFAGNVLGGTGLFALLAYGQVREEMN